MSTIDVQGVVPIYRQPAGGINVGTNRMSDVPFPLIIVGEAGDRYFHAYELATKVVWDVFLWHPNLNCPMYEVRASLPAVHGAWESGGGSIVYTAQQDSFDLSLVPAPDTEDTVIVVKIADGEIRADDAGLTSAGLTAMSNVISGTFGGFRFDPSGGVAIGVGSPPPGMLLAKIT